MSSGTYTSDYPQTRGPSIAGTNVCTLIDRDKGLISVRFYV